MEMKIAGENDERQLLKCPRLNSASVNIYEMIIYSSARCLSLLFLTCTLFLWYIWKWKEWKID